jgi:hypothetical protein
MCLFPDSLTTANEGARLGSLSALFRMFFTRKDGRMSSHGRYVCFHYLPVHTSLMIFDLYIWY